MRRSLKVLLHFKCKFPDHLLSVLVVIHIFIFYVFFSQPFPIQSLVIQVSRRVWIENMACTVRYAFYGWMSIIRSLSWKVEYLIIQHITGLCGVYLSDITAHIYSRTLDFALCYVKMTGYSGWVYICYWLNAKYVRYCVVLCDPGLRWTA